MVSLVQMGCAQPAEIDQMTPARLEKCEKPAVAKQICRVEGNGPFGTRTGDDINTFLSNLKRHKVEGVYFYNKRKSEIYSFSDLPKIDYVSGFDGALISYRHENTAGHIRYIFEEGSISQMTWESVGLDL